MAAPTTTQPKKADSKLRKYAQDLAREIGRRTEKLTSDERKRCHQSLLDAANQSRE
jgi:hypothetical protein